MRNRGPLYADRSYFLRVANLCAALTLYVLDGSTAAYTQERDICVGGAPNAPAVYVDSTSSEVFVMTVDGRQVGASSDLLLCPGDEVRTGPTGRVAIRFAEKRTVIRLDGNSRTRILSGGTGSSDVSLFSGVLYFVSSVRQQFEVDTPYIVAGIEGTEALVAVKPRERLAITAVRTGLVNAYDHAEGRQRTLIVPPGEAAFRSASVPFQKGAIGSLPPQFQSLMVVSDSAVDWAIYYPPILLAPETHSRAVRDAIILLSSGDYEQAERTLSQGSDIDPVASAALRVIIAVSRNRLVDAKKWGDLALQYDANFAPTHIAISYLFQTSGQLSDALEAAETAEQLAPEDAYVLARLAELQMTNGDREAALETADRSLALQRLPLALFVAGLAYLSSSEYERAQKLLKEAIDLDSEAPLPRLGLGLLYIRRGETSKGAWEIERALAHDPRRAALRNWLGRAYFDEGLPGKAREEFGIAKTEDPEDPNSYLFSAIERYAANRLIDALTELQEAKARRGARSVLRSERGLAEDAAVLGAALGGIYDTLGFEDQAIVEGSEAVDADPANPGAHRFLAQAYGARQGYEIVQTSELLRSQLLSPPSKTPVQPELAETRLGLLGTSGPARITFAEFAPLYDADGMRFDVSGSLGTQNTLEGQGTASLLSRQFSLSVGAYRYLTDGFDHNNDVDHMVLDAVTTLSLSPGLDLFGEFRHRDTQSGDRRVLFDLDDLSDSLRIDLNRDIYRLGFHALLGPDQDVLGLASYGVVETDQFEEAPPFTVETGRKEVIKEGQFQYIGQFRGINAQIGGSVSDIDGEIQDAFLSPFFNDLLVTDIDMFQANAYGYFIVRPSQYLEGTLGLSVDHIDSENSFSSTKLNPKLGLRAKLSDNVTLRAAYTNTMKRSLVADQTLEPTAVAGFSQLLDSFNGTSLERIGIGMDAHLTENLWIGAEVVLDNMDAPGGGGSNVDDTWVRGYVDATIGNNFAISIAPSWSQLSSNILFVVDDLETVEFPVTLSYFSESGFFGSMTSTFVSQEGSDNNIEFSDKFFVVDASVGYRFPDQRGIISLGVRNLLNNSFGYVERTLIDDFTSDPRFAREMSLVAQASLRF